MGHVRLGSRVRVRCLLAVVSLGTGAPDPRSAREVVAAFSEVTAGDSPTPEETAAMVSQEAAVALPKCSARRVLSKQTKAEPPTARYVPLASDTRSHFGLATGPCRLLQRGSLEGRDTLDQPEDCARSLCLARLTEKPSDDFLIQYTWVR